MKCWILSNCCSNNSAASSGYVKYSHSICSNSLVRKIKFPGVISFRKALPIWQIAKGNFILEVLWTFMKFVKIPCAVSGRKYVSFLSLLTTPKYVLNIKLKFRMLVHSSFPQTGHLIWFSAIIFSISLYGVFSETRILVADSINLSARKRLWQLLQSIRGSLKFFKWPLASHTVGFKIILLSIPTALGCVVTYSFHHKFLIFCFNKTPNGP